jgi:hypothetical protein
VVFDALSFRAMRRAMRHTPWYGSKFLHENIETWKQELVERRLCKRVAQVFVCSEDDRRVLGYDNVRVLPNCVDLPLKLPAGSVADPHRLLFIGEMDYEPNIDAALYFCKAIFPHRCIRHCCRSGCDSLSRRSRHSHRTYQIGGGTRIKNLDAFAHRKAVVSTTIGSRGWQ